MGCGKVGQSLGVGRTRRVTVPGLAVESCGMRTKCDRDVHCSDVCFCITSVVKALGSTGHFCVLLQSSDRYRRPVSVTGAWVLHSPSRPRLRPASSRDCCLFQHLAVAGIFGVLRFAHPLPSCNCRALGNLCKIDLVPVLLICSGN